jgi:zinc protease
VIARQSPPAASPSFSATYLAPAGFSYDPTDRRGISLLTNLLVTSGAGARDRVTLARDLDRMGATLEARCHPESAEVTVWGPQEAFGPLLSILADAVHRPRFAAGDLERVRRQVYERQLREIAQPDSRAERELFRSIFPAGHPYRETGVGTRRSVARLRRGDLIRFHRDHFTAGGSLVVVTAPHPLATVVSEVNRRFRDFEREGAPPLPSMPRARPPASPTRTIEMPGRSQVEILFGGPSIARASEEYPGAFLANEILGDRPLLSRLFQRVRESQGLAYHASSELEAMRWGGYWIARAGTGPERTSKVLSTVAAEIERIRSDLVPAKELEQIRESAIGELPLGLETTAGAHELAVDVVYHRLAPDHLRTWPARLRTLRPAEVRRGAEVAMDRIGACTIVAGPRGPARPGH